MNDDPRPSLRDILTRAGGSVAARVVGSGDVEITGITHDSRAAVAGDLFCCVRGSIDGHGFAAEAVARGASALLVDHALDVEVPQVVVEDTRLAVGPISSAVFGDPSRSMSVVGITGTNGKTTTAHLLASILDAAGRPAGVIGTLSGAKTTPEAPELHSRLAGHRAAGRSAVVMEVSSHALAHHRVDGTRFAAAVFTNLGRDHLDLHGTEQRYFAAKARLFTRAFTDVAVVNVDDMHGRLLADAVDVAVVGYSLREAEDLEIGARRLRFRWRGTEVDVPLGGRFNVWNCLAAAATAEVIGVGREAIVTGLANVTPVPGRFESIDAGQPFHVVVDYAHTPDGLRVALEGARETIMGGRVIVVFGCGGDRDADKRPLMGAVAAELADDVIVTSDNPRSEDPEAIIDAVLRGVPSDYRDRVRIEVDRRSAIGLALGAARSGDIVVVAGKGHEATQTIGATVLPFDDRAVARALLERRS